jgi:NIMA (never in mitosis gene a)-related kinase
MKNENFKFIPIKLLGCGSYGKAFLAESSESGEICVIKSVQIDILSEKELKDAYLEAKILEKLDHPNIIKFKEVLVTKTPPSLHIIMDYAEGGDLFTKIKNRKKLFSENQILDWFTQVCLALKHIHDRKILHRDLKSQNIFLTKNNLIKVGDFGIAKCLNYTLEKVQTVLGTPYYLSPEIVQNRPYSFKSDIWSLGVLLYEMCCLKMPFNAKSLPRLSLNIIKGIYNPLPHIFSKDLRDLVNSMLNVDPNKRPSVSEILSISYLYRM